jgi:DNA-binding cell septation regulator SpoVG
MTESRETARSTETEAETHVTDGQLFRALKISDVRIRFVRGERDGLLAWVECVLNGQLALNSIALRKNDEGVLYLTYPRRRTESGACFSYYYPVTEEVRLAIEREVLAELRIGSDLLQDRTGGE